MQPAASKIQDYAIIGDGRSGALISREGSIDWLCWPRFDSASIFAAMLDRARGGSWSISPTAESRSERDYVEHTNVLQTRFQTSSGKLVLTDFMPVASEEQKRKMLWPEQELVRLLKCEEGEMEVRIHFDPRPDYARQKPRFIDTHKLGIRVEIGRGTLILRSDIKFSESEEGLLTTIRLRGGEQTAFSLSYSREAPAVIPALGELSKSKLSLTNDWWQRWAERATYRGKYGEQVIRSALILKLLSYAPSGALVAAPTTSLPERVGGDLNWDYRFCWLRDAVFTVRALFGLGYEHEADAFVSWMLHSTRLTRPQLRTLYDVYGEHSPPETILSHLRGFAGSGPVRIGNAAAEQFQLDVYGEVVEAMYRFLEKRDTIDNDTKLILRQIGEFVCEHWNDPDDGIWEPRQARQHYTHSKLLCWCALNCLIHMNERGVLKLREPEKFKQAHAQIRRDIEERGWNPKLRSYTQTLDGNTVDASLLLIAIYQFEEASSERMRATHARVRERLSPGPGLLHRDEPSRDRNEGTFALCSFWEVDFLARGGGTFAEANAAFEAALRFGNDVGLFAEEIDPNSGDALGNFPQAFTHLGLVNAALSLDKREKQEASCRRGEVPEVKREHEHC